MLLNNIGTILTALVLLGIVTAVILKILRDRRKKPAGACANCPYNCNGSR